MAAIENLEQSVFPDQYVRLGESIETNKVLARELEGSQALLQLIHEEIQKAVKVCFLTLSVNSVLQDFLLAS